MRLYAKANSGFTELEQSNISDRENDVSRPEYENLIALAEIYGETLESLLGIEL